MSDNRAIVVTTVRNGTVVKACESWQAYDEWVEGASWSEDQLETTDCAIRSEDS